jgi:serine/threonine protein kinase
MERRVTVRQFIIQEMINESATTTVYKAHQSALDRTVLLKILHKHLIDDIGLTERFRREARACALIRSEFIVQVYDLTEIDGAPAIVMEYVEGSSLKEVLASEGPIPVEKARQIIIEALNALRAAHARGVIHRDIKPGNILVTETGHIKVTDFGLAAITASQTVTMDGAVLGTPAYLPPEHIRGEAADERSDLFSLGATFVEILTGQRIFEGASYSACINNILRFDVASIDALITNRTCADVIKQMMHPDREQRFASADAALAALHGEPEKLTPPVKPRMRVQYVAMLAGIVAVITGAVWFLLPTGQVVPPRDTVASVRSAGDSLMQRNSTVPAQTVSPQTAAGERSVTGNVERSPSAPPPAADHGMRTAEKDSSGLLVTCTPWGKVFLDNQYLGETPLSGIVTVRSGTHTLNFTNPQFLPIVKTITAAPGAQLTVAANFFETAGYIVITVVPWAEVYIDDQYRDTTPMEKPIIVTAGKRKVRLHNAGFTDVVVDVSVPRNDTLRLSYSLTKTQ